MNITLIGMSGAGKSFIGMKLAEVLGYSCIDTDTLIEKEYALPLQSILDTLGEERFLKKEEETILNLGSVENTIIAPGGSVVYSENALDYLKGLSKMVYIETPAEEILKRTHLDTRGIVGLKNTSFRELYQKRHHTYVHIADTVIQTEGKTPEEIVKEICRETLCEE